MARQLNLLSPKFVENANDPGRYSDGGGLYLQVSAGRSGGITKSWLFRYMRGGTTSREMGLGAASMRKGTDTPRWAERARSVPKPGKCLRRV
jgi:hypothetical protein